MRCNRSYGAFDRAVRTSNSEEYIHSSGRFEKRERAVLRLIITGVLRSTNRERERKRGSFQGSCCSSLVVGERSERPEPSDARPCFDRLIDLAEARLDSPRSRRIVLSRASPPVDFPRSSLARVWIAKEPECFSCVSDSCVCSGKNFSCDVPRPRRLRLPSCKYTSRISSGLREITRNRGKSRDVPALF